MRKILLLSFILVLWASLSWGATWYVRPIAGEYGAEDGTTYAAAFDGFSDIVWGGAGIVAGDTLYVCGTHTEALLIGATGSVGSIVTIRGDYETDAGIIDATGLAYGIYGLEKDYITITGMEVKNADDFGIRNRAGSNWLITFNTVHTMGAPNDDYPCDGIAIESGTNADASNNTISYNTVYEIGRHGIHLAAFITTDCQDNIIEHNTVYNCYHSMIGMQNTGDGGGGSLLHGNIIRYNHVYVNSSYSNFLIDSCGIYQSGSSAALACDGTEIYYNLIHDIPGYGIQVYNYSTNGTIYSNTVANKNASYATATSGIAIAETGVSGFKIKNNICTGYDDDAFWVVAATCCSEVDYNLWYSTGVLKFVQVGASLYHSDDQAAYILATGWDTNGLWEDPLLASATDFHLQVASPCIAGATGINCGAYSMSILAGSKGSATIGSGGTATVR